MTSQRVRVLANHIGCGSHATSPLEASVASNADSASLTDVIVVGAGFSGLCFLKKALDAGFKVRCFEKATGVGGTWFHNTYPGCACDIESKWYSLSGSFSKELQQEWSWSEKFSKQSEILAYLQHIADRFSLHDHIQFSTTVTTASFEASDATWRITTEHGERVQSRFLILAEGPISIPSLPDIPGVDTFAGRALHTAAWPKHEDLSNRVVGVIGTGASGVQVVCELAKTAKKLYVFQRTPCWCVPRNNGPWAGTQEEKELKARYDEERDTRWVRGSVNHFGLKEQARAKMLGDGGTLILQAFARSQDGKLLTMFNDADLNLQMQAYLKKDLQQKVPDPSTADLLLPRIPVGCKRAIFTDDYWSVFSQPNVQLVDCAKGIDRITSSGPVIDSKQFSLDALVYATGFDSMKTGGAGLRVEGHSGHVLSEKWAGGPKTHLGMLCHGFPNMLILTGPQSPSVLTNVPTAIEMQVEWMIGLLDEMRSRGDCFVEAAAEAEAAWAQQCLSAVDGTIMAIENPVLGGCESWYTSYGTADGVVNVPKAFLGVRKYADHLQKKEHLVFRSKPL